MSKKFKHLNFSPHWQQYFSKYPDGYTIIENLIDWISQVNKMVESYNELTDHVDNFKDAVDNTTDGFREELDTFLEQFDVNLAQNVITTLSEWQDSGFLDIVIDEALNTKYHEMDERLTNQLNQIVLYVDDFGAVGDGVADDTQAIQDTLDYASEIGATVRFKEELYMVDALASLNIPSKSVVDFTGTVIKALPNDQHRYSVIDIAKVENVVLINPTVVGDRDEHITSPAYKPENVDGFGGEWGFGIRMSGSKNIDIYNANTSKCWGDGIIISVDVDDDNKQCENVNLYGRTISRDNRRQGVSVICGKDIYIEHLEAYDMYGTKPMRAIDFESNPNTVYGIDNLRLDYLKSVNCSAPVEFVPREYVFNVSIGTVEVVNNREHIRFANRRYENSFNDNISIEKLVIDEIVDDHPIHMEQWFDELSPFITIDELDIKKWTMHNHTGDYQFNFAYAFLKIHKISDHFSLPSNHFKIGGILIKDAHVRKWINNTSRNTFNPSVVQSTLDSAIKDNYTISNISIKANELNPLKHFSELRNYSGLSSVDNVNIYSEEQDIHTFLTNAKTIPIGSNADTIGGVGRENVGTVQFFRFNPSDGIENLPNGFRGFLIEFTESDYKFQTLIGGNNGSIRKRTLRIMSDGWQVQNDWTEV